MLEKQEVVGHAARKSASKRAALDGHQFSRPFSFRASAPTTSRSG